MKISNHSTAFLLATGVAGTLFSCQNKEKANEEAQGQPNIIFIMCDDHAYQAISAYGSTINQTPNIDRIAEEGMLFNQCFVTNSISAPSRAVILTGKHSHINGVVDNRLPFDSTQQTFPKILQKSGYQTAMIGKWHLKTQPTGFDYWKVLPGQGNYYNPDFRTPEGYEQIEGYVTDIVTDVALDFLKNKRDENKPFMMMYHHKAPHRAWWPGPDHLNKYDGEKIPEPETLYDDYADMGTAAKEAEMRIMDHMNLHGDLKIKPDNLDTIMESDPWETRAYKWNYKRFNKEQREAWDKAYDPMIKKFEEKQPEGKALLQWKYQRYLKDYLRCIASVDDNVGRLLDYLEESGLAENTIVVYTSDQGFYLGEHGWFDKRFMYKESFRTPLLVRWPKVIKPGTKNDDMVMNLDFAETFLDAAGANIPEDMQGKSMLPIFKDELEGSFRDAMYYHYYEYPAVHMVKRHYGIRTDRYKLMHFYYDIDEWELYDMEKDPLEQHNVINDPEYADVLKELKAQLQELRKKYKDSEALQEQFIEEHLERRQ